MSIPALVAHYDDSKNEHLRSSWQGGAGEPRRRMEAGGDDGNKRPLLGLTEVLNSDGYSDYYVDDYVLSVFAFGVLAFVGLALLWPAVHTRRRFASLKKRYQRDGRPVLGIVLEEEDIETDIAAAMMMRFPPQQAPQRDGWLDDSFLRRFFFCCCRSGSCKAGANYDPVVVQYESDECRMIKPFYVTGSTHAAALNIGTMPLLVLPSEDKSAMPEFYLRTRSPFGWGRYLLWGMTGALFLAWSAYFATEAVVGGTKVLTRIWSWGDYLSWSVVGVMAIVVINLSYLLCRCLTRREYEGYVNGGAVYYPRWRSKSKPRPSQLQSQSQSQLVPPPISSYVMEEQAPPRQRRDQQQEQQQEQQEHQFQDEEADDASSEMTSSTTQQRHQHQEQVIQLAEAVDDMSDSTFELRAVDGSHGRQGDDDVTEVVYELVHVHKRS